MSAAPDVLGIIERKKRGRELTADEIAALVAGFTAGQVPAYQMSAWLMAVWFRGLNPAETVALTDAMLASGSQLDLSCLSCPTADKHSTGGVGDKVSLLLAPLAAACGLAVPMLSGRGLGHTGGTLDKLAAIPGYRTDLTNDEFLRVVAEVGCAVIGQGPTIAPADGRIYALRDVTGTVDCVPLITASILSKKLAAGPASIVIDLKIGSGAFMPDLASGRALAAALMATAARWGRRTSVVFSDMSQPLGTAIGHASEVIEAFSALRPAGRARAPADLVALTEELTAEMLLLARLEPGRAAALARVRRAWDEGLAFERMLRWVSAQGGRLAPDREDFGLVVAPPAGEATAARAGWIEAVDCREVGLSLGDLGAARRSVEDSLDLTTGILFHARIGQRVDKDQPLATILGGGGPAARAAAHRIAGAVTIAQERVDPPPLVLERLTSPAA